MLGDGNIQKRKGIYQVRISGHSIEDKEYLCKYVKPLIKELFGIEMKEYFFKDKKLLHLTTSNKKVVLILESLGLAPGNKKQNNSQIPTWIFESKIFLKSCIRGLIDTDGSVIPITGRNYTYIWFSSSIPNLRTSFDNAMVYLDYKTSKWSFSKNSNRAPEKYIAAKTMIRKYYKEIGFHNPKHIKKFSAPLV